MTVLSPAPSLTPAAEAAARGLLIPAEALAAIASAFSPIGGDDDATLIGILAALEAAESRLELFDEAEHRQRQDHPEVLPELDRMDLLLLRAASLRPREAPGIAAMAKIADRYMADWRAGELVARQLLRLLARRGAS